MGSNGETIGRAFALVGVATAVLAGSMAYALGSAKSTEQRQSVTVGAYQFNLPVSFLQRSSHGGHVSLCGTLALSTPNCARHDDLKVDLQTAPITPQETVQATAAAAARGLAQQLPKSFPNYRAVHSSTTLQGLAARIETQFDYTSPSGNKRSELVAMYVDSTPQATVAIATGTPDAFVANGSQLTTMLGSVRSSADNA